MRSAIHNFRLTTMTIILLTLSASVFGESQIRIAELPATGFQVLKDYSGKPSGPNGILETYELILPEFTRGCWFSADGRTGSPWPSDANRELPWILHGNLKGLFEEGYVQNPTVEPPNREALFALFQLKSGEYLALLPVGGPETMSWLRIDEKGRLLVHLGTFGTEPVSCDAPLLIWSRSPSVFQACRDVWAKAVTGEPVSGQTAFRKDKLYPEPFRYLGWCSWEQYHKDISEELLVNAVHTIEKSGIPVRWALVDDGHQTINGRQLVSFVPDPVKFPRGWDPFIATRNPDKIKWLGLWHCFHGYWGNIHEKNNLGGLNQHLVKLTDSTLVAKDDPVSAKMFYDTMIGSVKSYGFDFVKIDVQASNLEKYRGRANAVRAHVWNARALEEACLRDMQGLINCMAHNTSAIFNTRYSAVSRCSIDYKVGNADRGKSHIVQSFTNTLWLGQTVWPDHDMFHSSDPNCGQMMAVTKALSGGPIYLSDAPESFISSFIRPLAYEDGKLLRPVAPGTPLPDSVFLDALNERQAYRVIAPLSNGCAAVAVYNLNLQSDGPPIRGLVSPSDYPHASTMIQPWPGPWSVPEEGLVIYDWYQSRGEKLDSEYSADLKGFSDRLFLLAPIRQGWALVGRADKYLAPDSVDSISATKDSLSFTLTEAGPFVFWSGQGTPRSEGVQLISLGNGFWKGDMAVGQTQRTVTIAR